MTDLTPEALEARNALADAVGNGESDAVLVSSDPDGPSLWTKGLKTAVFAVTTVAVLASAKAGAGYLAQEITDATFGPREEISFMLDEPTVQAFAEQVGPKIYGYGLFGGPRMVVEVGETSGEDSARFFTYKDPSDEYQRETECYALYLPALRDALGSEVRLENSMESFALAHCMMAGRDTPSLPNVVGEGDLGRTMTNLAAARLIEGNVLGEDGRDLTDSSSVRDAWFASQFSQDYRVDGETQLGGLVAYMVLRRADDTLLAYDAPGTIPEFKDQVHSIVERGFKDMLPLVRSLDQGDADQQLTRINGALREVYNGASPETRLDRMDAFMRDPVAATRTIETDGLNAYLEGASSRASLDRVQVSDPFSSPVVTVSFGEVQAHNPFEARPEADMGFEDGPRF